MTSLDSMDQPNLPHVADQIAAYLAGGLPADERTEFEAHVAECADCAALLDQLRDADSALVALFAAAQPSEGFEDRLVDSVRRAPASRWPSRLKAGVVGRMLLHPNVRRAALGVAAAVVLAAVGHAAQSALEKQTLPGMRHGTQFADLLSRAGAGQSLTAADDSASMRKTMPAIAADNESPAAQQGAASSAGMKSKEAWGDWSSRGTVTTENVTLSSTGGLDLKKPKDLYEVDRVPGPNSTSLGSSYGTSVIKGPASVTATLDTAGTTTPANGEATRITGALAQSTGTLSLSGTNTVSGATNVTAGTLATPAEAAKTYAYQLSGTSGKATAGATTVNGGGTLDLNGNATQLGRQIKDGDGPVAAYQGNTGGIMDDHPPAVTTLNEGFKPTNMNFKDLESKDDGAVKQAKEAPTAEGKPTETAQPPAAHPETSAPNATVQTRVYDIHDLVLNVPNFTDAPKFDLTSSGASGAAGGKDAGGGSGARGLFGGGATPEKGKSVEERAEEVTKLIQETVSADSWKETGGQTGAIKELNGKIVVTQTPENQRQVEQLLEQLRDPKKGDSAAKGGDLDVSGGKPGDAGAPGAKTGDVGAPDAKPQAAEPGGSSAPAGVPAPTTPAPTVASAPTLAPPAAPTPAELQAQAMQRKIIRNGEMLFDVDSFDSSMMQVGKIAAEEGGFIATTDSEKLPNGKVKGSVIVRCPPERLDTLVLKLRGLGDLKSQRIAAQDITKQYTDIESQLRAAHAMEDRLLGIIKDGKGAIKDLLEAEKQLGVWREKLEALEGEIRYYNNLVSLSTLTVTLTERDIKTPYATAQSEQVSMGVEAEDVEKARAEAISQIEAAKGRILQSDLKKQEAAQFSAVIVADVAPDAADPLIDRLKQIGRVARLERERKQTSEGGTGTPPPGVKIERQDTRLQLSIYNLADISPRTTTSMNLAAADVEKSYKSIVDQVKAGGGRIVSSQLNRPKAEQVTGTITFDVPSDKADVLSAAIRSGVEVMRLDVNENKDTQDVTDAKKGFVLQIYSLASVAPRETTILQIASKDVPTAFNKLLEAALTAGGRVSTSQLNEQNVANITGTLDFDVPRDNSAKVDAALREAGLTVTRNVSRSPDSDSTVDSKVRLQVTLIDEVNLTARQSITQSLATKNVPEAFNKLADALHDAGARIVTSQLNDQDKPTVNALFIFTIERPDAAKAEAALHEAGETVGRSVGHSADLQNTVDSKLAYQVTILDQRNLQPRETVTELLAVRDVPGRYARVLDTLRLLDAQIYSSQLIEQNKNDVSAVLDFAVRRDSISGKEQGSVEKALGESSDVFSRNAVRSQDVINTVDTKIRYQVTLKDADTQPPRETTTLEAETPDVEKALSDFEAAANAAGGRAVDSTPVTSRNDRGELTGRIVLDVPLAREGEIINAVRDKGRVSATRRSRDDRVPQGELSRARIEVTLGTGAIMAGEGGLWDPIKSGLRTSATGLMYTLQFIIIGLCLIGPIAVVLWVLLRLFRWARRTPTKTVSSSPAQPPGPVPAAG